MTNKLYISCLKFKSENIKTAFYKAMQFVKKSKIESIINTLSDCKMVLSMRIGYEPKKKLMNSNIIPIETYDKVQEGILEALKSVI